MSQRKAKKLRKRLRDERVENGPLAVEPAIARPMPKNLLMRRKDPLTLRKSQELGSLPGTRAHQGGAILHPLSERAMYQFAKKRGLGE